MSITETRRALEAARADAEAFRELFAGYFERWEVAGSVRRGKPDVGDVEHVVIPTDRDDFLGRMDQLLGNPMFGVEASIEKAVYPNGTRRWGDKYRGCLFRGFRHEVFLADRQNWGAILAIRTGPAAFSERLVTQLKSGGRLHQHGGYVRYIAGGAVYGVPEERGFFEVCREPWAEPEVRA